MHAKLKFTDKAEIARFTSENGIRILNLCHVPEDGRLKTLSFSVVDKEKVYEILEYGERVDGSNLFSFIEPSKSDIYIMPRTDRAFINPFSVVPTLNVLCDYLDENGRPLDAAPRNVLIRAEEQLRLVSDVVLRGLVELEFYIISKLQNEMLFPGAPDKNYHESAPFTRFEGLRNDVLASFADVDVATKYGHSEVGRVFKDGLLMEQQEVEFAHQNLAEMAENIAIAKWIIRNVCVKHGVSVSFSPKVSLEHAGTGMHVHLNAVKDGENVIVNPNGSLSVQALKIIGGILKFAPSLSAFGNTTPVSYLRFIARKESPMHICWSARNRLALIRIPLWWSHLGKSKEEKADFKKTFEYRAPDPFANAYLLFAGIVLAAKYGLENSKEVLKIAENLHFEGDSCKKKVLRVLPRSCYESAKMLEKDRMFYEANSVFPKKLVDKTIDRLRAFKDKDLWKNLAGKSEKVEDVLEQYLHYG